MLTILLSTDITKWLQRKYYCHSVRSIFAMRAHCQTAFHSRKVMSALLARVTATFVRQSDILPGLQVEAALVIPEHILTEL
jgi:hypothetical protein